MTVSLSLLAGAGWQFFDDNGNPLSGGLLYTYEAGTTTPQTTYTDSNGNVANSNPIVLDAAGRVPYQVWLTGAATYKFILKTSTGVTVWSEDDVPGYGSSADIIFLQAGTGAVARTVQSKLRDVVSVKDFGAVGDGVTDDYTAISNALSAAIAGGKQLVFPPGIYAHSGVINFASQGLRVRGDGLARLKYTGVQSYGVAVASDLSFIFDVWIENLFIEAGNRTYGFYVKNSAHGIYKDITIINSTEYGAYLEGSVLDTWENLRVTSNPPPLPGQTVTMPKYGLYLNNSTLAVQATANTFINPIIEGVTEIGIVLEDGANNTFIGGTSEGNSGTGGTWNGVGIYIGANSPGNTFNNTFCEANKSGDLICYGKRNNFLNCTLSSRSATIPYEAVKSIVFQAGSEQNKIIGSNFYAAEVIAGAVANSFEYCDSQFKVDDAGTRTQILWTRQLFNTSTIVPGFKAGNLANADPLVLDWYQEGTFTPTFGGSTGDGSVTFDIQDGTYTRIGNTVTFRLAVRVSLISSGPTGDLLVRGLPFAASATPSLQAVAVGGWSNITLPASRVDLTASVIGGTTTIQLLGCASGLGLSAVQASGLGASYILIGGSYTV